MTSVLTNDDVSHGIWKGDCLELLPALPEASVDFILTDPPYITRYRSRDGRTVPNDNNDAWLKPAFAELYRVLKPDSFAVSFYGWAQADRFLTAFRAAGFRVVGHVDLVAWDDHGRVGVAAYDSWGAASGRTSCGIARRCSRLLCGGHGRR